MEPFQNTTSNFRNSMLHCSVLSEQFQPLAENIVANLVEVAVPLLTSFRGHSMVWAAASRRRMDFPLFFGRSLAGKRQRSLLVNVGGWWLQQQIERLKDFFVRRFCWVFLRRTRFFFFSLCTNPKTSHDPLFVSALTSSKPSQTPQISRGVLRRGSPHPSCFPPSHHPLLPASLSRERNISLLSTCIVEAAYNGGLLNMRSFSLGVYDA